MDFSSDSSESSRSLKASLTEHRGIRRFSTLHELTRTFSPFERLVLYVCTVVLAASTLGLLAGVNAAVSVDVPSSGGSLVEGEIGPARFINPLIAMSQADLDLSMLVYSGLMRAMPDGSLVSDLASSYEISADGTTYTFKIRDGAKFHDGARVTSADVVFTVQKAQDPAIKSSHRADWEGVQVSAPDAQTVVFKLPRAYAPFLQNTTMGILPQHLWADVTAEEFPFSPINTHPVGTGPYKVAKLETNTTGSATRYELEPFKQYALGTAYIKHITFLFYPNEDAIVRGFNRGEVDAIAGISPDQISAITRTDTSILKVPLPRVFGVFLNQNHAAVFTDASARSALDAAIDKQRLIQLALRGFGVTLSSPIPPSALTFTEADTTLPPAASTAYTDDTIANARAILQRGGWKFDESTRTWTNGKKQTLSFALATADSPELVATANAVAAAWTALGAQVDVQIFPIAELNTTVIRPRQYDALLFGEVVGRELDLFAFWHSSQRNDPGLNLALYTNSQADTLLANARATTNEQEREKLYTDFAAIVTKDKPAIFLYAPDFLYAVPKNLRGIELGALSSPAERFLTAYKWYADTERVWSIFAPASSQSY